MAVPLNVLILLLCNYGKGHAMFLHQFRNNLNLGSNLRLDLMNLDLKNFTD